MNLGKVIAGAATAPVRVSLAAADAGLAVAALALGFVKQSLGEEGAQTADPDGSLIQATADGGGRPA